MHCLPARPAVQINQRFNFGIKLSALLALLSIIAVIMSIMVTDTTLESYPYFEQVFWNGGHIAQFCYTVLLMLALLWIGAELAIIDRLASGWIKLSFLLTALPAILAPVAASVLVHQASEYRVFFTRLMEWGHLGVLLLIAPYTLLVNPALAAATTEPPCCECLNGWFVPVPGRRRHWLRDYGCQYRYSCPLSWHDCRHRFSTDGAHLRLATQTRLPQRLPKPHGYVTTLNLWLGPIDARCWLANFGHAWRAA